MVTAVRAGNLQVDMALNSGAFESEVKRSMGTIERSTRSVVSGLKVAGTAAAGFFSAMSVSTISRVTLDALRFAGALDDTAKALGLSARELQGYRYAATQSGVAAADFENGLEKLQQKLGLALSGAGKDAQMFKALGIDITDATGKARSSGDVFAMVADQLGKIEDPSQRAAAAVKIFGEDVGPKLLPLLDKGRQGMDELRAAAERLGIVLSDSAIQSADVAAKKVDALQQVLQAKIAGTVAENADAIVSLADALFTLSGAVTKLLSKDLAQLQGFLSIKNEKGWWAALNSSPGEAEARGILARTGADRPMSNFDIFAGTGLSRSGPASSGGAATGAVNLKQLLSDPSTRRTARAKGGKAQKDLFNAADARAESFAEVASRLTADADVYGGTVSKIRTDMQDIADSAAKAGDVLAKKLAEGSDFAKQISGNIAQGVVFGQSVGAALVNSFKAAAAEALSNGLFELLGGGKGGGLLSSIGGFFSTLFGVQGKRANGGWTSPGGRYLVGERGPEIFEAPASGGNIRTRGYFADMQQEAAGTVINVDARGSTDPAATERAVLGAFALAKNYTDRGFQQQARPMLARGAGA